MNDIEEAFKKHFIKDSMTNIEMGIKYDWGYAHGWWCNLKFNFLDRFPNATPEQVKACEEGATNFMQQAFDYKHDPDGYKK